MKKLVTHANGFHADDVMAYAILQEVLTRRGETWEITRTRDRAIIDAADIVFDVGEEYDPQRNRYDHHQKGRAGARDNGVFYASAGLVWKHFGRELCSNDAVWKSIESGIIMELDAIDSGQNYVGELNFKDAGYTSLAIHIAHFENSMFEPKSPEIQLASFEQAAAFARGILTRAIHSNEAGERAFQEASEIYQQATDKQILVFQKNYERPTWRRLAEFPEPVFIVYPNEQSGGWKVEAVTITPINVQSRKYAPESWHGLRADDLQQETGVSDATFCHPSGFLFGAVSFEGAMQLAKIALES